MPFLVIGFIGFGVLAAIVQSISENERVAKMTPEEKEEYYRKKKEREEAYASYDNYQDNIPSYDPYLDRFSEQYLGNMTSNDDCQPENCSCHPHEAYACEPYEGYVCNSDNECYSDVVYVCYPDNQW